MKSKPINYQIIFDENGKSLQELWEEYLQIYYLQKEQEYMDHPERSSDHD